MLNVRQALEVNEKQRQMKECDQAKADASGIELQFGVHWCCAQNIRTGIAVRNGRPIDKRSKGLPLESVPKNYAIMAPSTDCSTVSLFFLRRHANAASPRLNKTTEAGSGTAAVVNVIRKISVPFVISVLSKL